MKCPKCQHNQKFKQGLICDSCKYVFALNPKQPPGFTDLTFQNAVDRLSASGKYYYTYNQLVAQLIQLKRKKEKRGLIGGCSVVGGIIIVIMLIAGVINFRSASYIVAGVLLFGIIALALFIIRVFRGTPSVNFHEIEAAIKKYTNLYPLANLADGATLNDNANQLDLEALDFAPESILIVEHNDMAEMLILNGLHLERKALILSADKHPASAFRAYRKIIEEYPGLPIALMHDASEQGLRMKARLIKDPEWLLEGKTVKDLGLSPKDISQLKSPIWFPPRKKGILSKKQILNSGESMENIGKGYTMPLDISPPRAIIGALGLALLVGVPLLSEAFMEEQLKQANGSGASGSYGFG